ncbi:MAG: FkbM family methyltransferase [Proteobacteria bacterium]|nr:FkbM family methyltransferase [Pseudomonadota bacterium]
MSFVLHFLKENDLFVDVGANVGVYTILASKIGRANSIAVEPIPTTYQYLLENIRINEIGDFVETYNAGLGAEASNLYFTSSLDVDNRVIMESEDVRYDKISVPVLRLDSIVSSNIPSLIKIDVEGYESKVLEGGEQTLKNKDLKAIIIELNGSGKKFGFDDDEIHNSLLAYAFKPYSYEPNKRELLELSTYGKYNTIYIRDLEYVTRRIKSANPFKINKYSLSI